MKASATAEFSGRRLLVLGAGHHQVPLIRCARRLGCTVVTADHTRENPGHALADESRIVSTVDHHGILALARSLQIDGVVTFGSDVSAPTVTYVAQSLGLPGNSFAAGSLLQRKDLTRELQRKIGLPHPAFLAASSLDEFLAALRQGSVPPPILVKPVDSSGSKGQSVLASIDDASAAYQRARAFSRCDTVIAERLLQPDMLELVGDIYVHGGQLRFGHYGHNYFLDGRVPRVPVGEITPGFFGDDVERELDRQLQAIVEAAGVDSGCMNFDALVSKGEVHLLDIGLRNGGNYLTEVIRLSSGVDLAEAALYAAFGREYPIRARHESECQWVLSYLLNSATEGTLRRHRISPSVREWLVDEVLFVEPGARVKPYVQGDHGLGICLLVVPSREHALALYPRLPREVQVDVA